MRLLAPFTLIAALLPLPLFAQPAGDVERARARFEAGRALFQVGSYEDAIREFEAGYALVPKPRFLLNLGQCYRKLGDLARARDYYRRYLAEAATDDPERQDVARVLDDIEREIAAHPPPPATPPAPAATAPPTSAAPATQLSASAPPPHRATWKKHLAWIVPVGAVVVGAALGLGIYFGTHGCPASLGCVDAGH